MTIDVARPAERVAPGAAEATPERAAGETFLVVALAAIVLLVILGGHVAIDRGWMAWGAAAPIALRSFVAALALAIGVVVLAGYRGRRRPDALIVGTAMLGVGLLLAARTVISVVGVQLQEPSLFAVSIKMGWAQGVYFPLVLILGLALVAPRRRRHGERAAPRITFVIAACALGAIAFGGPWLPLFPGDIVADAVVARPAMAWPAALHLFLLSMIWRRRDLSASPGGRWLTFAVYVGLLNHLLVGPFWSSAPQSAGVSAFNAILGLLTYGLVGIGAVIGMVATARAEAAAAERAEVQHREQARVEAELVRQAGQLRHANEELAQYAYFASHDLQEPLRMVTSYLQLVERRYRTVLDDEGLEFMHFAVDGAQRMKRLINDLLAYSQVGTRPTEAVTSDADRALEVARRNLAVTLEEAGATLTHDPLPSVPMSEVELVQLFQNLVGNAVKFTRSGVAPHVHVRARREGAFWRFEVEDNGPGIDPEYHDRVFAAFGRLDASDTVRGSGIGLALCRKIVSRRGGEIWFESRPDAGTTFVFTVPVDHAIDLPDPPGVDDAEIEQRVTTLIERARAMT